MFCFGLQRYKKNDTHPFFFRTSHWIVGSGQLQGGMEWRLGSQRVKGKHDTLRGGGNVKKVPWNAFFVKNSKNVCIFAF